MIHLTRRAFIKAGAVGAAGLTILNQLEKHLHALEKSGDMLSFQREIAPFTAIPSVCLQCSAGCGVLGLAVDDELVGILGNPLYPGNKGGICTRAAAMLNLIYDKDRILTPLKRNNSRGKKKWEKISWEQAIKEISVKLNELKSMTNIIQIGANDGYTPALDIIKKIGRFSIINDPLNKNLNKIKGHELFWGDGAGVPDVANSRFILNFGSNPYENHDSYIPFVQRLIKGRVDNKAKLITFDVRLSNTAGRSDVWLPLKSGTDVVIILAMCNIILKEGLEDRAFLNKWLNVPVNQLSNYLSQYSLELAENESGIKAEDIKRIAVEFASQKPSVAFCGSGITNKYNGTNNQMAVLLLNAITGNIDKMGGYCLPKSYSFRKPAFKSLSDNIDKLIDDKKMSIGLYMSYLSNPVYSNPNGERIQSLLSNEKKVPYYVAVDTHVTETSKYADIILPAATHIESWGLDSPSSVDMRPYLGLRKPVIKPLGKARSFPNILSLIGKEMGKNINIDERSNIEKLVKSINKSSKKVMKSLEKDGYYIDKKARPQYGRYRYGGFKTRSGKLNVRLRKNGKSILPGYESVGRSDAGKGKLFFTTFTEGVSSELNPNSKWLAEINHDNPLWINTKTAGLMGIKTGDSVEVKANGNKSILKVHVTQMVHPEVAAISKGQGHWEYGSFSRANKIETSDDDTSLVWWNNDNSFHINRLVEEDKDSISGGEGKINSIVTIKKVG